MDDIGATIEKINALLPEPMLPWQERIVESVLTEDPDEAEDGLAEKGYCSICHRGSGAQEQSVREMLDSHGELSKARAADGQMLLGMARACDKNPDRGALWREFRIALQAFHIQTMGSGDDDFERLAQALATPLGDTED